MQVHSIITNTITDDIRQKGHQSIRFSPDGFSVFIADQAYNPVYLKSFQYPKPVPEKILAVECRQMLEEQNIFSFKGDTVFVSDARSATLVPDKFFNEENSSQLLILTYPLTGNDMVLSRQVRSRPLHLVYSFPDHLFALTSHFSQEVRVLHASECMVSLSDQVSASDHQRGFVLLEIQSYTMEILVIRNDEIILSNRYWIGMERDIIYHTLNTIAQLKLDRESIPLYYAGILHDTHEITRMLQKFIRKVEPVPYFIDGLDNRQKLKYILLSEATRCV